MIAKKVVKTILAVVTIFVILITLFICSFFINHNFIIRWSLTKDFKDIINDNSQAEIIESKSVHGKLNGNGNGINYFGTVLIKAESEEKLAELLPLLDEEFGAVGYMLQPSSTVNTDLIEHVSIEYDHTFIEGETYYSIYYFNLSNEHSYPLDIRGH